MKKLLSAVMALVMVLSLTACGAGGAETEEIRSELEGSWTVWSTGDSDQGTEFTVGFVYIFEDDKVDGITFMKKEQEDLKFFMKASGEYGITGSGKIKCKWDDTELLLEGYPEVVPEEELSYKYKSGELSLYCFDEKLQRLD